ncbi:hypothetical protein F4780DRAFT_255959 [Xylariomycetidae sp. FL0641]|nr:hypothetical protein F4780DRAFT_255959 [Xylariomycetidae sp. FL0641]
MRWKPGYPIETFDLCPLSSGHASLEGETREGRLAGCPSCPFTLQSSIHTAVSPTSGHTRLHVLQASVQPARVTAYSTGCPGVWVSATLRVWVSHQPVQSSLSTGPPVQVVRQSVSQSAGIYCRLRNPPSVTRRRPLFLTLSLAHTPLRCAALCCAALPLLFRFRSTPLSLLSVSGFNAVEPSNTQLRVTTCGTEYVRDACCQVHMQQ